MGIKGLLSTTCFTLSLLMGSAAFGRASEVIMPQNRGNTGSVSSSVPGNGQCNVNPAEKQCVNSSNFGKEFAETIFNKMKGKRPAKYCLRGVRESLQETCSKGKASWGCAEAEDAGACFTKLGFTQKKGTIPVGQDLKPGTVIVYAGDDTGGGPGAGHVEVYTGTQLNGKATYCSDYCADHRRDQTSPTDRPILAYYEPPSSSDSK